MKKIAALFACMTIFAMWACKQKVITDADYPVYTQEADTPVEAVTLHAKVAPKVNLEEVTEGGFYISEAESLPSDKTKSVPSLGINTEGSFIAKLSISADLANKRGTLFYYQAWINRGGKIETGKVRSFLCPHIKPESITLSPGYLRIDPAGNGTQLTATIKPDNATDRTILWTSSDPAVATVSNDGLVTGKKAGRAVITATVGDVSAECVVSVKGPLPSGAVDLGFGPYWRENTQLKPAEGGAAYYYPANNGPWYRWGELKPKETYAEYARSTYDYAKYGAITVLSNRDDPVYNILGGTWRLPTEQEYRMLLEKCKYELSGSRTGWYNVIFTSKVNGNKLSFGCEGFIIQRETGASHDYGAGSGGYYWTATAASETEAYAFIHDYANYSGPHLSKMDKACGFSLAAVAD